MICQPDQHKFRAGESKDKLGGHKFKYYEEKTHYLAKCGMLTHPAAAFP